MSITAALTMEGGCGYCPSCIICRPSLVSTDWGHFKGDKVCFYYGHVEQHGLSSIEILI